MGKKGNYICPICKKDCGNPPALKLHENYCKGPAAAAAEKKDQAAVCDHDFRLLRPAAANENAALKDGFLSVCTKCQDLQ